MAQPDLLLAKAERFIRSARLLAEDGDLDSAVSRLYYAMFFTAEALLAERGLFFASHMPSSRRTASSSRRRETSIPVSIAL